MGDGRGKSIPGVGNSIYEGTEAGNDVVYLGTKGQCQKRNRRTCVLLQRTTSSTQHWTSTRVKSGAGLMERIRQILN